ncbi:MAG: lysophospholipid acyltransferase family protein [Rickettsiales bacterium]
MPSFRALFKTALFLLFAIATFLWMGGLKLAGLDQLRLQSQTYVYKLVLWLANLTVSVEGGLAPPPSVIVSNHCSYMDIFVLGSLGNVRFTPKSEIKSWFFAGWIVTLFDAVYVERKAQKSKEAQTDVLNKLKGGARLSIFPEGTTNNGMQLQRFKSSLFSVAEAWDGKEPLAIQPVTVRYETLNGKPLDVTTWPFVAWYGDASFAPHIMTLFAQRSLTARVICHAPLYLAQGLTRKELAKKSEEIIRNSLGKETN